MLSEVSSADWLRLTHYLEAKFPELKNKENKEGCCVSVGGSVK
jgi:hypothetical protein